MSLLRAASSLVEDAALLTHYPTDMAGLPTKPEHVLAFMEATCTQVAYWAANDIDPAGGNLAEIGKGHATSKTIKGASVSYSVTLVEANNLARAAAVSTLGEAAWSILRNAGLISAAVR